MWSGLKQLEPGAATSWQHHGQYAMTLESWRVRFVSSSGSMGAQFIEACPGDIIHVPAGAIHRELNTANALANTVLTRVGQGQAMDEVDGPSIEQNALMEGAYRCTTDIS